MSEQPRFFTLEEATRALPLVRRIVEDIVDSYPAFREQVRLLHEFAETGAGREVERRLGELRAEVDRAAARINGYIAELRQVGCLFKGFEEGLVDFYSLYQGRPIFLCWKLGEEEIRHWHEVDAGFAGRQALTPEVAAEVGAARN